MIVNPANMTPQETAQSRLYEKKAGRGCEEEIYFGRQCPMTLLTCPWTMYRPVANKTEAAD